MPDVEDHDLAGLEAERTRLQDELGPLETYVGAACIACADRVASRTALARSRGILGQLG